MLLAHQFLATRTPPPPPVGDRLRAPLTPAGYIRLRRKASDLSIDQVAERIASKGADLAEVRALVRMLETDGVKARSLDAIELLRVAFPIDPAVYHQLATEPADRHPSICRGCGCSHHDPCGDGVELACGWAMRDLCTRCSGGDWF